MKSSAAFLLLLAMPAAHPLAAQKIVDIAVGISPPARYTLSHSPTQSTESVSSYIPADSPNPGPYVIFGALVGAAAAGLWEAHAVSRSDDMVGTGGLLWIPPVAGALLGGIGGWLVFKIVHSNPNPD